MGIINTQAVADGRKVRTGKDGALYNGKGKLLATVETFQAQMAVANQKYHPLGTPLRTGNPGFYWHNFNLYRMCGRRRRNLLADLLKMQNTGIQPNWKLQGVVKGINGSEERLIYPNCVPSGNIDLQNVCGRKHCKTSVVPVREWRSKTAGKIKGLEKKLNRE
ncbi:MAG: hypothetical protein ACLUPF_10840 [Dorea sp.]